MFPSPTSSKWQVQWVDPEGMQHTRMFRHKRYAEGFAIHVRCLSGTTPELWEMS